MGETHVFKTTFATYFTMLFAALAVVTSAYLAVTDPRELLTSVPLLLGGAIVVWILFGAPRVVVSDGGITIVNVLRTIHVPWPCFLGADSEWNLRVRTDAGTYTAWALPIASGTARRLPRRRGEATDDSHAPVGNHAQGAALLIGERHAALADAGHLGTPTTGVVSVHTQINRATAIGGLVTAALLALALL